MELQTKNKSHILNQIKEEALKILKGLASDDIGENLNSLKKLQSLPKLPKDESSRELKDYKEVKDIYKKLHIESARTIISVIESDDSQRIENEKSSFNNSDASESILAANMIKFLPNAFIGGPMRVAIRSNNLEINKIAIKYYDSLPSELKYSEVFAREGLKEKIKFLKEKINE